MAVDYRYHETACLWSVVTRWFPDSSTAVYLFIVCSYGVLVARGQLQLDINRFCFQRVHNIQCILRLLGD